MRFLSENLFAVGLNHPLSSGWSFPPTVHSASKVDDSKGACCAEGGRVFPCACVCVVCCVVWCRVVWCSTVLCVARGVCNVCVRGLGMSEQCVFGLQTVVCHLCLRRRSSEKTTRAANAHC